MSVFDPDLKYLVRKTDPYQYYLFSEVSQITDCKGTGHTYFIKDKIWNAIAALRSISYYMNWYFIYMQE